jgi:hypothetical protein
VRNGTILFKIINFVAVLYANVNIKMIMFMALESLKLHAVQPNNQGSASTLLGLISTQSLDFPP